MTSLILAAAIAVAQLPPVPAFDPIVEAERALAAGRLDQSRTMIAEALKAGLTGDRIDLLLAEIAFASGDCRAALPRYEALLTRHAGHGRMIEPAGICAARLGKLSQASSLLDRATALPAASWRAWNARGVVADNLGDWEKADASYARAATLAPASAEVANNQGWSLLLRGRWNEALTALEQAAALDPKSGRIANNLELARAALSEELPQRREGENDQDWTARLNDAGVVARFRGENRKAIAAFAQAIETRGRWYERAANNLAIVKADTP